MMMIRNSGRAWLEQAISELESEAGFDQLTIPDLLNHLVSQGRRVQVNYIHGHWLDVNSLDDIDRAGDFTQGR